MKTTGEDIFKALENVDEHYIEEGQQSGVCGFYSVKTEKTVWKQTRTKKKVLVCFFLL